MARGRRRRTAYNYPSGRSLTFLSAPRLEIDHPWTLRAARIHNTSASCRPRGKRRRWKIPIDFGHDPGASTRSATPPEHVSFGPSRQASFAIPPCSVKDATLQCASFFCLSKISASVSLDTFSDLILGHVLDQVGVNGSPYSPLSYFTKKSYPLRDRVGPPYAQRESGKISSREKSDPTICRA